MARPSSPPGAIAGNLSGPIAVASCQAERPAECTRSGAAEQRRILHCDMDCFFAAVHIRDDPSLRGRPVVVGGSPTGRGVVAAASYEARAFGIHSAMPAARALRLCPQVVFLRPDFALYRTESERIFAIYREITPLVQPMSVDEAYLDVTGHLGPFGSATAIAQEIRRRVRQEIGLTVSVGVATNRLLAKLASDHRKPDGLTVIRPHRVQAFLDPLPTRRLAGVGPATERRLQELGVHTVADLRRLSRERLGIRFGRSGQSLWEHARGIDDRPVSTSRRRKSLSAERTYERDLEELPAIDEQLAELAQRVARGLARRQLAGRTVTLKVRYDDFTTTTRARTLAAPVKLTEELLDCCRELLSRTAVGRRPVRLLGIGVSGFASEEALQLTLFEDPTTNG